MSDTTPPPPDSDAPSARPLVDLTDLKLMPSWVANFGATPERDYSKYEERPGRGDRGDFRGDNRGRGAQGDRRGGAGGSGGGGRGDFGNRSPRPAGPGGKPDFANRPPRRDGPGGPGGDRPQRSFGDRPPRRDGPPGAGRDGGGRGPRFGGRDGDRRDMRPPLPTGIKVTVEPSEAAAEALATHVRTQGRAFSVFDGARLVLDDGERHRVRFDCESERLVGLFHVPSDGSLFETREEAVRHLLRSAEALAPYYKVEDVELEEPKGNFTSVAVCSLSGEILGPPSHHSYQTALKRLHTERFANMPLEAYKRNLDTKTDAELVAKWKEQQRKGQRWLYQKGEVAEGAEPQAFSSRADMESHFRRLHGEEAVVEVREALVSGAVKRYQLSSGLGRLMQRQIMDSRKHLFELAHRLSVALERRGLKLFKRRAGKMYVSRIKPKALDPTITLSDNIRAIVEKVRATPGLLATKLIEELAPTAEVPAAPVAEGETAPAAPEGRVLTDAQRAVIRDLHWLADEGYVIEYSDGTVFMGVQAEAAKEKPAKPVKEAVVEEEASAAAEPESKEEAPEPEATAPEPEASSPEPDAPEPEASSPEPEATAPEPQADG